MPPTAVAPAKKKSTAANKTASDAIVPSKAPPPPVMNFSLFTADGYEMARYTLDHKDWVEVSIFVNGWLPPEAYKVYLDGEKTTLHWQRATPQTVFRPQRLQQVMTNYDRNHSRVVAHSNTHQELLRSDPVSVRGWYFDRISQAIPLKVKCVGTLNVIPTQFSIGECNGHQQYNTIYTVVMEVASERIQANQSAKQVKIITLNLDDDDDEDDDNAGGHQLPPPAAAAPARRDSAPPPKAKNNPPKSGRARTASSNNTQPSSNKEAKVACKANNSKSKWCKIDSSSSSESGSDYSDDDEEEVDDRKPAAKPMKVKDEDNE